MKKIFTLLACTALSFSSVALEYIHPETSFTSKVERLLAGNAKKIDYFEADFGFTGIGVITKQHRKMVFYTNDKAEFLLSGVLLDTKSSENLSTTYSNELEMDLGDIPTEIAQLEGVTQGEGTDEIYAVIDVNCGFCHVTWKEIQKIYAMNPDANIKVHWIPVGFLGSDSISKAQALAGNLNNENAFELLEAGMSREAVPATMEEMVKGESIIQVNEAFMKKHNFGGVPLVISKIDGKWNLDSGRPGPKFFQNLTNKNLPDSDKASDTAE